MHFFAGFSPCASAFFNLEALGAPRGLIRKYAFRNAVLPQLTGLALQLGVIVAGALVTEVVFSYPGIGYLILQAINTRDFFLLQGCFLFIILGVLVANFALDISVILYHGRVVEMGLTEKVYNNPLHPYTEALMSSVPRLDKRWAEVEQEMVLKATHPVLPLGYAYYHNGSDSGVHLM